VNNLPAGWEETTVGAAFAVVGGGTPARSVGAYWDGGIPWITSADIGDGGTIEVRRHISNEGVANSATSIVPADSVIVVTRVGLGKVARTSCEIAFSQDCQALLPVDDIDPEFLRLQLSHTARSLKAVSRGTTINGVTKKQLLDLPLMIPPLPEQKRIVAAIEEEVSRLDFGAAALQRAGRSLKRMRAAALQRTAPHPLQRWTTVTIDETIRVVDYRGRTPPFSLTGIPHLRSFNVKNGAVNWDGCAYVAPGTYETYMSRGFPERGDLLFTTEAPMGEVAVAPEVRFCMAQRMMLLKPDLTVWLPEYLMYHLQSPWFQSQLALNATGTTVRGISSRNFRTLGLVAPSLREQELLVTILRDELVAIDGLEKSLSAAAAKGRGLNWGILNAAFSGELVPQDSMDEPASALLERIVARRASATRQKSGSRGRRYSRGIRV
jgi:type I restriction enzyme S subunit